MAMQARLQRRRSPDNRLNICSADWKCPILGAEARVARERANDVSSSRKRKVAPICTDRQVHHLRDERDRNRRLAQHLRLEADFPRKLAHPRSPRALRITSYIFKRGTLCAKCSRGFINTDYDALSRRANIALLHVR